MTATDLLIDESFVSRLMLGALSEHEQRMLTARLAHSDLSFRDSLRIVLEPFESPDSQLVSEYSTVLELKPDDADRARSDILARSFAQAQDLEAVLDELTIDDALALGEVTRQLFSWSMAELLLERGVNSAEAHRARTSLYLASMVIDIVEILGVTGHSPYSANVIVDVRQRIQQAAESRPFPKGDSRTLADPNSTPDQKSLATDDDPSFDSSNS